MTPLSRKTIVAINPGCREEITGSGVPEGFTLPWNTTRTMADVWADDNVEQRRLKAVARVKQRDLERQRQFVTDYQRRQAARTTAVVTASGRAAYAGYDGDEA